MIERSGIRSAGVDIVARREAGVETWTAGSAPTLTQPWTYDAAVDTILGVYDDRIEFEAGRGGSLVGSGISVDTTPTYSSRGGQTFSLQGPNNGWATLANPITGSGGGNTGLGRFGVILIYRGTGALGATPSIRLDRFFRVWLHGFHFDWGTDPANWQARCHPYRGPADIRNNGWEALTSLQHDQGTITPARTGRGAWMEEYIPRARINGGSYVDLALWDIGGADAREQNAGNSGGLVASDIAAPLELTGEYPGGQILVPAGGFCPEAIVDVRNCGNTVDGDRQTAEWNNGVGTVAFTGCYINARFLASGTDLVVTRENHCHILFQDCMLLGAGVNHLRYGSHTYQWQNHSGDSGHPDAFDAKSGGGFHNGYNTASFTFENCRFSSLYQCTWFSADLNQWDPLNPSPSTFRNCQFDFEHPGHYHINVLEQYSPDGAFSGHCTTSRYPLMTFDDCWINSATQNVDNLISTVYHPTLGDTDAVATSGVGLAQGTLIEPEPDFWYIGSGNTSTEGGLGPAWQGTGLFAGVDPSPGVTPASCGVNALDRWGIDA